MPDLNDFYAFKSTSDGDGGGSGGGGIGCGLAVIIIVAILLIRHISFIMHFVYIVDVVGEKSVIQRYDF